MEVNGFIIEENGKESYIPNRKTYLVYHPVYDGFFKVYESNSLDEAVKWCEKQNFSDWTRELEAVALW
ncbi:hypothetical protein ACNQFZ_13920 [Schinkia sp. CFF1]